MPTGYTADIENGISFKEYALKCARAFGACVEMRDDPNDAPIPEKFKVSDYHTKALAAAKRKLTEVSNLSIEDCAKRAEKEYNQRLKEHNETISKKLALKKRYEDMLAEVRAWKIPSPDHTEFARLMESQIVQSIDFDCDMKYYKENKPQKLTGTQWKREAIADAKRDIEYHTKNEKDDIERNDGRNLWIKQLRDSLK